MTFERFDVVVVPFPFTDRTASRRRPAVILSDRAFAAKTGQSVLAMITRAQLSSWPGDTPITDLACAGLKRSSFMRLKLFTLVNDLIDFRTGKLGAADAAAFSHVVAVHLGR